MVYRVVRAAERGSVVYTRLPDAYVLAEAGASLLCTRLGYELEQLWYEDPLKGFHPWYSFTGIDRVKPGGGG